MGVFSCRIYSLLQLAFEIDLGGAGRHGMRFR
jgi:hypothetical protein